MQSRQDADLSFRFLARRTRLAAAEKVSGSVLECRGISSGTGLGGLAALNAVPYTEKALVGCGDRETWPG